MQTEELEITKVNQKINSLDDSYIIVVMPQGLGDILFFCIYAKEYRKMHSGRKLALVVSKLHFLDLANLYSQCFETILYVPAAIFDKVDNTRFTYFFPMIYDEKNPQTHLAVAVRRAMGIENCNTPYYPIIYVTKKEKKLIEKYHFPRGKTVLIAPEAVSCTIDMTEEDWVKIADRLADKGLTVFFNSKDQSSYGKYPKVFLPMRETLIFTHYAGYFIGFRSGLCDVIAAFSDCKQIIIYPNNKKIGEFPAIKNFDFNPNIKYMEYCSLREAFPDRIITEFVYEKDKVFKVIEREFRDGKDIG